MWGRQVELALFIKGFHSEGLQLPQIRSQSIPRLSGFFFSIMPPPRASSMQHDPGFENLPGRLTPAQA